MARRPAYAALLRAVNVGGTGKLPMSDLARICENAGLHDIKTYLASGNVVFSSDTPVSAITDMLEQALLTQCGQAVTVFILTAKELARILASHPFQDAPGNKVIAIVLKGPPEAEDIKTSHQTQEMIHVGQREITVFYPEGQGTSRLKLGAAQRGTGRNMNTIAQLATMVSALE